MRHHRLIPILVLATAGCSVSSDDVEPLDQPGATELPHGVADALTDDRNPLIDSGGYGILLIDVTSSMNTVRPSTGNTRCDDAKVMAQGVINDFFNPARFDGDGIAIWGFTNDPYASDDVQPTSTGYYTDSVTAIAAVNALSCEGSSPLADALCKGVDGDGETFTIDPMLDQLFILTDGFENNSDGPCSGPSGRITTAGTWQANVLAQMVSAGIRVDTRYWVDPTILSQPESIDSFAAEDEPLDPSLEELQIVADIEELPQEKIDQLMGAIDPNGASGAPGAAEPTDECDVTCQELELFEMMALESGGTWGVVKDDDSNYPNEETVDPATGPVHPKEEPPPPQDAEVAQ